MPVDVNELCPSNDIVKELNNIIDDEKDGEKDAILFIKNIEQILFTRNFGSNVKNKKTVLMKACDRGLDKLALYIMKIGMENGSLDLDTLDAYNNTALIWAVRPKFNKVVLEMLKYNFNVGQDNIDGITAFSTACQYYDIDIVNVLIDHFEKTNSDINEFQLDKDGNAAFDFLLLGEYAKRINKKAFIRVVKWLLERYQEHDSGSDVLQRNIIRICADHNLMAKLELNPRDFCAEPKAAVADFLMGEPLESPRSGKKSKRATKGETKAKALPLPQLAIPVPGERPPFLPPSPSEYERYAVLQPKRPFPSSGHGGGKRTRKNYNR